MKLRWIIYAVFIITIFYGGYSWYKNYQNIVSFKEVFGFLSDKKVSYKTPEERDQFVRFDMEVYDKIIKNYWSKINDGDLSELFRLSLAKVASTTPDNITLPTKDRAGTAKMIAASIAGLGDDTRKKFTLDTAVIVLYNLQPAGRGGLLSSQEETALRNNENNVNPSRNLYRELGVQNGASPEEVDEAFENKKAELLASTSPEAKSQLAEAAYARKVLTNQDTKARYDQAKVEPTVFRHIIGGKTLYLYWNKVSPTTLQEFGMDIINASTTPGLDSLIIDLRDNIGGSLDFAQYFLGLFLGQNQYAYDLFHQGDYQAQRTVLAKLEELDRYKEIAVLTNEMTQSTAELIAASLKRFRLAKVVGTTTRGWGTVENTFPMDTIIDSKEKYSVLLVHSLTLRDDNQPIESRGVDPDVDTAKFGWQNNLSKHFQQEDLISILSKVVSAPPMK